MNTKLHLVGESDNDWFSRGICKGDSDIFFAPFAERPEPRVIREEKARKICGQCAVKQVCRAYARANGELGFWGGESESERVAAGYAPTTPVIGRRKVAEQKAKAKKQPN